MSAEEYRDYEEWWKLKRLERLELEKLCVDVARAIGRDIRGDGWAVEVVARKSGKFQGQRYREIVAPCGKILRSMKEVMTYLADEGGKKRKAAAKASRVRRACRRAHVRKKDTALQRAAHSGHYHTVKRLIDAGADVNKALDNGATPLFIAAQQGHVEIVRALIDAGADVNKALDDGATPLFIAAQQGHVEIVRVLKDARLAAAMYEERLVVEYVKITGVKPTDYDTVEQLQQMVDHTKWIHERSRAIRATTVQ
jgi:ribosomal protein L32